MKTSPATTEPANRPATTAPAANMADAIENICFLERALRIPHGPAPQKIKDAMRMINGLWLKLREKNSKVTDGRP